MAFLYSLIEVVFMLVPVAALAGSIWWLSAGRRRFQSRSWEGVLFIGCTLLSVLIGASFVDVPRAQDFIVVAAVAMAAGLFGMPVRGQPRRLRNAALLVLAGAFVLSLTRGFADGGVGAMFGGLLQVRLEGQLCLLNAERGNIDFWLRVLLVYLMTFIVDMAFRERAAACAAALVFFLAAGGSAVAVGKVDACGYQDHSHTSASAAGLHGTASP